jgi:hypothetical protein
MWVTEVVVGIYTRLGIEWKMLKSVGERVETPCARARVKFLTDAPRLLVVTNTARPAMRRPARLAC